MGMTSPAQDGLGQFTPGHEVVHAADKDETGVIDTKMVRQIT
jgi:hypothetical protein